jgi:hypothetical protein
MVDLTVVECKLVVGTIMVHTLIQMVTLALLDILTTPTPIHIQHNQTVTGLAVLVV